MAWSPDDYARFHGPRLRPAIDLLNALRTASGPVGSGAVCDLGCGSGVMGPALRAAFDRVDGVDTSEEMLGKAAASGAYDHLTRMDIAAWADRADGYAVIYSNAALNWLPDHEGLFPKLVSALAPGGVLAVQMPRQSARPSHALWRDLSQARFPDRFDWRDWTSEVHDPGTYATWLTPMGALEVWETEYYQFLHPQADGGHPVRHYTRATYGQRVLGKLSKHEAETLEAAYDGAVSEHYRLDPDGGAWFPFRRLFMTLRRPRSDTA